MKDAVLRRFRLKTLLTAGAILAPVISLVAFGSFAIRAVTAELTKAALAEIERSTLASAERIRTFFEPARSDILILNRVVAMQELVRARARRDPARIEQWRRALERVFLGFSAGRKVYNQIRYLDEGGQELVRVDYDGANPPRVIPRDRLQNQRQRYYFQETMTLGQGRIFVSPLDLNREHGRIEVPHRPVLRFATPVFDEAGIRRGIVITNLLAARPLDTAQQGGARGRKTVVVVDQDGFYLSHPDPQKRWGGPGDLNTGERFQRDYPALAPAVLSGRGGVIATEPEAIIAYQPVVLTPGGPGRFIVLLDLVPRSAALAGVAILRRSLLAFLIVVGVLAAGAGLWFARRIADPVRKLEGAARRFGQGDLKARVEARGPREIASLAAAFNTMAGDLEASLRRLRDAEQLSEMTLASLIDAVVVVGRGGRVRYANRVFYEWFGLEPSAVLGQPLHEVLALGRAAQRIEGLIRDRVASEPFEITYRHEGGEERIFRATVSRLQVEGDSGEGLLILEEITAYRRLARERQALQAQLIQAEKLSALGQLVAGVAHELNNPLAVIMGRIDLLLGAELDERTRRALGTVRTQADRMKRIIQHLHTFARRYPPERAQVDLNAMIREVVELRAYEARINNIEVRCLLDEALPLIVADPHQLHQVFLNLFLNAEQAMAGRPGVLTIRTERVGEAARISVADTGPGIPPEHLSRVFDPFFTTREVGKGTGLGLSVSYSIVEAHGGRLRAESVPGEGATFIVELPIVAEAPAEPAGSPPLRRLTGRRILVVDDEAEILQVLADLLALDGHQVVVARSGEEALACLALGDCDLILSDIRMPGLDGPALYRRLEAERPEYLRRLIFVTGDTVSPETQTFLEETGSLHLAKPFTVEAVRRAIAGTVVTRRDL